ncbi:hypothetical protein ABBQ32_007594 [Trebouxia sp. C0010 RCD-2024]
MGSKRHLSVTFWVCTHHNGQPTLQKGGIHECKCKHDSVQTGELPTQVRRRLAYQLSGCDSVVQEQHYYGANTFASSRFIYHLTLRAGPSLCFFGCAPSDCLSSIGCTWSSVWVSLVQVIRTAELTQASWPAMSTYEQADLHISRQPCGPRDVKVSSSCPAQLQRTSPWRVEDFDLHKRLYQGKASLLYSATCKKSQLPVAVKVYRKARLSELNWYQVGRHQKTAVPALAHVQLCPPFDAPGYVYVI